MDAWVGIIGTLAGAVLGFGLNELQNRWRERRVNSKVRSAIAIEIDHNLKGLQTILDYRPQANDSALQDSDFWTAISEGPQKIWFAQTDLEIGATTSGRVRYPWP